MSATAAIPSGHRALTGVSRAVTRVQQAAQSHPAYVWTFILFLVTDIYSGYTKNLGLPIGPDRIFFGVTLVLLVLDPRADLQRLRFRALHVVAFIVVCAAGLSALEVGTLQTSLGLFALLDRLIVPYITGFLAPVIFRDAKDRDLLAKALGLLGIYLGFLAFCEVIGPHALVWPRYIQNPNLGDHFGRARGPFLESESDGLAMLGCTYCSIWLFGLASRRWRIVGAVCCVLCVLGGVLTLTRSIWIGMVLGPIVVAVLDKRLRRPLAIAAVVAAVGVTGALAVSGSLRSKVSERAGYSRSVYDRQNTDVAAFRAIREHPLFGIGWLKFIDESEDYVRQNPNYPITSTDIEIHNVFLSRITELGIPIGLLWIVSLLMGPGLAWLRGPPFDGGIWRLILVAYSCAWVTCAMLSPVSYPLPNVLIWLFAGLALSDYLLWPSSTPQDPATARTTGFSRSSV